MPWHLVRRSLGATAAGAVPALRRGTWQSLCSLAGVNSRHRHPEHPNKQAEFYSESKWCDACKTYVRFLMSVNHSYCVGCGGRVRLFNRDDGRSFSETVQRHKWQAS